MNSGWTSDEVTGIMMLAVLVNDWSRVAGTAKPRYVICCHGDWWFRVGQLHHSGSALKT